MSTAEVLDLVLKELGMLIGSKQYDESSNELSLSPKTSHHGTLESPTVIAFIDFELDGGQTTHLPCKTGGCLFSRSVRTCRAHTTLTMHEIQFPANKNISEWTFGSIRKKLYKI